MPRKNIEGGIPTGEFGQPVTKIIVDVPGIGPGDFNDGHVDWSKLSKLEEKLVDAGTTKHGIPAKLDWHHVIDNIDSGRHKGFFVVTSGAIIITLGTEFLVRHGEDVSKLIGVVRKHYKKDNKK